MSQASLETRIARARAKSATADVFAWPRKPSFIREVDKTEREARVTDLFHCVHNKHYFVPCNACKRTAQDAEKQLAFYKEKLKRVQRQLGL